MARLYKKTRGAEAKLGYLGHVLTENRNGLVVDVRLTQATGTAERDAALEMLEQKPASKRVTLGADRGYDTRGFVEQLRETERDAACGAEQHQPAQRHRRAHDAARRLRGQPEEAQARRGSLRLDEDGGAAAQDALPGTGAGRLDVHLRGRRLQPGADAQSSGRKRLRRSVSGGR